MGWDNFSYQKKGAIIGAILAIIVFSMFHLPTAVLVDSFFTKESNMINEVHLVALIFVIVVIYCAFMGQIIGKIMDVLQKNSQP